MRSLFFFSKYEKSAEHIVWHLFCFIYVVQVRIALSMLLVPTCTCNSNAHVCKLAIYPWLIIGIDIHVYFIILHKHSAHVYPFCLFVYIALSVAIKSLYQYYRCWYC